MVVVVVVEAVVEILVVRPRVAVMNTSLVPVIVCAAVTNRVLAGTSVVVVEGPLRIQEQAEEY